MTSTLEQPGALIPSVESESWLPILQDSNQVVLYNPTSHALSVNLRSRYLHRPTPRHPAPRHHLPLPLPTLPPPSARRRPRVACPYCKQLLPPQFHCSSGSSHVHHPAQNVDGLEPLDDLSDLGDIEDMLGIGGIGGVGDIDGIADPESDWDPAHQHRLANYFHLLELSNLSDGGPGPPGPPARTIPILTMTPPLPAPPFHTSPPPPPPVPVAATLSSPSFATGFGSAGVRENGMLRTNGLNATSAKNGKNGKNSKNGKNGRNGFPVEALAEGYFKAFFQEEYKLGMGANGSVFLCQHMIDGAPLGHFAVKKIAVGESHSYLLRILREVRLLEQMRHPNIITYQHAWLESCQFSVFGPKVPTLHVLMQWAEGGSLDDFIDVRLGRPAKHVHVNPLARFSSRSHSGLSPLSSVASVSPLSSEPGTPRSSGTSALPTPTPRKLPDVDDYSGPPDIHSRSARIRAFRAYQKASPEEKDRMKREVNEGSSVRGVAGLPSWKAVHLLSAEEIKSLFSDVVEGLAFLHEKSILHLDLKPGNVLLTWDEGKLIPRAMLSDFGTSRDMMNTTRVRSGNTGTLEYSSPESLPSPETGLLRQIDSKADMWSLGMILHKLLFFRLPYRYASDGDTQGRPLSVQEESEKLDRLEKEVLHYPGFKSTQVMMTAFEARRLPRSFLILLESLLNVIPLSRPSVERISVAMKEGKFDPQETPPSHGVDSSALSFMPVVKRAPLAPIPESSHGRVFSPLSSSRMASEVPAALREREDMEMPYPGRAREGDEHDGEGWEGTKEDRPRLFAMEMMRERVKLLGPPEGAEPPDPDRGGGVGWFRREWRAAVSKWERTFLGNVVGRLVTRTKMKMGRETYVRMVKSCLLSVKILTISRSCIQNAFNLDRGMRWKQPWVLVLLGLALLDTVSDEMWLSAVLLLAHVVMMKWSCGVVY